MSITVVNKYKHTPTPNDLYIGRGSKWGNPFKIGEHGTRTDVIQKYREYLIGNQKLMASLHELKGKTLVCFCKPQACHGDVLKELADMVVVLPNVGHTVEPKDFQGFPKINISNKEFLDDADF